MTKIAFEHFESNAHWHAIGVWRDIRLEGYGAARIDDVVEMPCRLAELVLMAVHRHQRVFGSGLLKQPSELFKFSRQHAQQ